MPSRCWLLLLAAVLGGADDDGPAATPATVTYEVPRLDGLAVDGRADDWGGRGFSVRLLHHRGGPEGGRPAPAPDFDPRFRLGWDPVGLLVLIEVADDRTDEGLHDDQLWRGDSAEVFVADAVGGRIRYQVQLAAGAAGVARHHINDQRQDASAAPLAVEVAATTVPGGYRLEARLPWANLGRPAAAGGETCGFQLYVNDRDGEIVRQALFFPLPGTHADSRCLHALRLADAPSPPIDRRAWAWNDRFRALGVTVCAAAELADRPVRLLRAGEVLAASTLTAVGGRAEAVFPLPLERPLRHFTVEVDGADCPVQWPALEAERLTTLLHGTVAAAPAVFAGDRFPVVDFADAPLLQAALGGYRCEVVYFDADHRRVMHPTTPGRYGAVMTCRWRGGRTRRFATLYRLPEDLAPERWTAILRAADGDPAALGLPGPAVGAGRQALTTHLDSVPAEELAGSPRTAALLAGLARDPAADPFLADQRWWIAQQRLGYAMTRILPPPATLAGDPATVLRRGDPVDAGLDDATVAGIDRACQDWVIRGGQPFTVCLVKDGVVFLHRAYGADAEGRPATLDRQYWLASLSKLFTATVVMQAVDHGLADLDEPLARHWPQFGLVPPGRRPLTLRHCLTHTGGFTDHWGMGLPDLEDRIAGLVPILAPGRRWQYQGTGYELAAHLVEQFAGEPWVAVLRTHLLEPLGIADAVTPMDACGGNRGTAAALATVGQLLLNRGSYGTRRCLSPEAFAAMLPRELDGLDPDQGTRSQGLGTVWFRHEGLGDDVFGHGAASGSILRIAPDLGLVVAVARDAAGNRYDECRHDFFSAIQSAVAP
jgi:CubicO group peptidase (beta-lactamase class C family)